MRRSPRSILASACVLALAACNEHRYGFFPGTETDGEFTSTISTTDALPTTLGPTSISPTTPTTVSPTSVTITTETTVTVTTDPTFTVTTESPHECELVLPAVVPIHQGISLSAQGDDFSLSCGGVGGTDIGVVWTAPATARYQFDTIGSTFDSLLAVLEGTCSGKELACDDDSGGDLTSKAQVDLVAGQTVTLVIDSFGQSDAEVLFNITEVPVESVCPDAVFDPVVPLTIDGQTLGAPNVRGGSCGGSDSPEIEAMWTAPFEGQFVFEVIEADFDPVLYLLDSSCNGPEFTCNNDSNGPFPAVSAFMFTGQTVVLVVDGVGGTAGKFLLSIHEG
ncbi:hypothetical protein [Nannocystis sp. SCPEA4]|uniref:hypothetical protein n=1 Tax=Nannocystis sp. SCPEA4 TaxID=2996787 RepID=UPI00227189CB|nr:hypothetical protein [Nannocystis sp. SCPEA4]MCY1054351.1 hypothetical protein [Nannocystis sp. SCPEA4]